MLFITIFTISVIFFSIFMGLRKRRIIEEKLDRIDALTEQLVKNSISTDYQIEEKPKYFDEEIKLFQYTSMQCIEKFEEESIEKIYAQFALQSRSELIRSALSELNYPNKPVGANSSNLKILPDGNYSSRDCSNGYAIAT